MSGLGDELLRRRLAERGSTTSAPALKTIARSVAASHRRRVGARSARWPILGSAVACAIVAGALVGGLLNRSAPPLAVGPSSVATQAGGSSSEAASASPRAADEVAATWSAIDWRRLSSSEFPQVKTARVSDAVAFGDGFVAVGTNGSVGRIWRSTDGMTWSTVGGDWLNGLQLQRIVTVGDRLVTFGQREGSAGGVAHGLEMWSSTDGLDWEQGPPTPIGCCGSGAFPIFPRIVGGPLGVLVRGDGFTFLLGPDLTAWTDVTPSWPDDVLLGLLVPGDRHWIQLGATGVGEQGISTGAIWTSTNGQAWSKATIDDPGGTILSAYRVDGGYVAIGSGANVGCRACFGAIVIARIAWFSADGSHWTRMTGSGGDGDDRIFGASFAGDGRRLLAFTDAIPRDTGTAAPVPVVSETIDGRAWTSIETGSTGALPPRLGEGVTVGRHGIIELPGSIPDVEGGVPTAWWGQAIEAP